MEMQNVMEFVSHIAIALYEALFNGCFIFNNIALKSFPICKKDLFPDGNLKS